MNHYCIYTQDITPQFLHELGTLHAQHEMHFNRTRFWLDPSLAHHVEFYLKWSHCVHTVHSRENLATGVRE